MNKEDVIQLLNGLIDKYEVESISIAEMPNEVEPENGWKRYEPGNSVNVNLQLTRISALKDEYQTL